MSQLTNVGLMLLELILEQKEVSGYEINALVEKRGFREWADIGTTSIYTGLKKLEQMGFLDSNFILEKKGRGPLPRYFKLTKKGLAVLKAEIYEALSATRERDRRFDLGLSGLPLLTPKKAVIALQKRQKFLSLEKQRISSIFRAQGGNALPLFVRKLFEHTFNIIDHEIKFISTIIEELKKEI